MLLKYANECYLTEDMLAGNADANASFTDDV